MAAKCLMTRFLTSCILSHIVCDDIEQIRSVDAVWAGKFRASTWRHHEDRPAISSCGHKPGSIAAVRPNMAKIAGAASYGGRHVVCAQRQRFVTLREAHRWSAATAVFAMRRSSALWRGIELTQNIIDASDQTGA